MSRRRPRSPRRCATASPAIFTTRNCSSSGVTTRSTTSRCPIYGFDEVALANEHGDLVEGHYTRWLRARRADGDSLRGQKNATPDPKVVTPQAWRTRLPEELYPTSYVAEITKDYLEKFAADRSRPFFLKCSFPDPHHPFTPPGRYFDMYDPASIPLPPSWDPGNAPLPPHVAWSWAQRDAGKAVKHTPLPFACTADEARQATALTYGMITMIDDAIGGILAKLAALGLADDTVVIFTADHGDFMGDHQLLLKGPMHYQGILRVPFIWVDPDRARERQAQRRRSPRPTTFRRRCWRAPASRRSTACRVGRCCRYSPATRPPAVREILIEEEGQRLCLGFADRVRMRVAVHRPVSHQRLRPGRMGRALRSRRGPERDPQSVGRPGRPAPQDRPAGRAGAQHGPQRRHLPVPDRGGVIGAA